MWKMSLKCEETSLNIRQIFLTDVKSAKIKDREILKWKKINRNKYRIIRKGAKAMENESNNRKK